MKIAAVVSTQTSVNSTSLHFDWVVKVLLNSVALKKPLLCCETKTVYLMVLTWPTVFQCYANSFEYTLKVLYIF